MTPTITLRIPAPLRAFTRQQSAVPVEAGTVGAALDALVSQFPGLRPHLFDEGGTVRSFVNLYRNDEDVRYLDQGLTELREGDELFIVPSIAGGAAPHHG